MKRYLFVFFLLVVAGVGSVHARKPQEPIKILAIGNSFSVDGVEYLDELAAAAGVEVIVGNLNIGGCSLERHWNNAANNIADYEYYKYKKGQVTNRKNVTLAEGIADEKWDYITLQQRSPDSGIYDTYFPYITDLIKYLCEKAADPDMQIALQQTWAYASDSSHPDFKNYNRDEAYMYRIVTDTYGRVAKAENIKIVIPSGTAVQNMKCMVGNAVYRDGYHLSYDLGRYTASCAWFETFIKKPVTGNSYKPRGVTADRAAQAQKAAHAAKRQWRTATLCK